MIVGLTSYIIKENRITVGYWKLLKVHKNVQRFVIISLIGHKHITWIYIKDQSWLDANFDILLKTKTTNYFICKQLLKQYI